MQVRVSRGRVRVPVEQGEFGVVGCQHVVLVAAAADFPPPVLWVVRLHELVLDRQEQPQTVLAGQAHVAAVLRQHERSDAARLRRVVRAGQDLLRDAAHGAL